MLRLIAKPASLLVAALLVAGLAFAQTGAVNGKVKGEDGKPLQGALIKIERKDMRGNYEVKTNKKGEYYYMGLPAGGTYSISLFPDAKAGGQPADMVNSFRLSMGEPMEFNFDLSAIAAKRAAMAKAAESGQVTQEMSREMSTEQKAQFEKTMKDRAAQMAKNKVLQEAFNNAMTAMTAKDYPTAIENFKKAGEVDPKQHVVWANMGESYILLSKTKTGQEKTDALTAGIENYNKALELKPDDGGMHNNLALAYATAGKFPEAKVELEKAAALDPTQAGKYYYNLGAILTNTNQPDAAQEAFKKAIELDANYADAYYQLAVALSAKMQIQADGKVVPPDGMREALEKYLQLRPDGSNAEAAKGLLSTLGMSLTTKYENPDAKKKKAAPVKK
jgi:tetratricopeptide (TPR) repeat protein